MVGKPPAVRTAHHLSGRPGREELVGRGSALGLGIGAEVLQGFLGAKKGGVFNDGSRRPNSNRGS